MLSSVKFMGYSPRPRVTTGIVHLGAHPADDLPLGGTGHGHQFLRRLSAASVQKSVPAVLGSLMGRSEPARALLVMGPLLNLNKLGIGALESAYDD